MLKVYSNNLVKVYTIKQIADNAIDSIRKYDYIVFSGAESQSLISYCKELNFKYRPFDEYTFGYFDNYKLYLSDYEKEIYNIVRLSEFDEVLIDDYNKITKLVLKNEEKIIKSVKKYEKIDNFELMDLTEIYNAYPKYGEILNILDEYKLIIGYHEGNLYVEEKQVDLYGQSYKNYKIEKEVNKLVNNAVKDDLRVNNIITWYGSTCALSEFELKNVKACVTKNYEFMIDGEDDLYFRIKTYFKDDLDTFVKHLCPKYDDDLRVEYETIIGNIKCENNWSIPDFDIESTIIIFKTEINSYDGWEDSYSYEVLIYRGNIEGVNDCNNPYKEKEEEEEEY